MARLNQHTTLSAVKEKGKNHIKVIYSKKGKVKRFKTNVYVLSAENFNKNKVFRKKNALSSSEFQSDKDKIDATQLRIETLIDGFYNKHFEKPDISQLESLILNFKETSTSNYNNIIDYLEEYFSTFKNKRKNQKSVIISLKSGIEQFCIDENYNFTFEDIDEEFFKKLMTYFLFRKPKSKKIKVAPNHQLQEPVAFDKDFGMNNNTLIKRLAAFIAFLSWALKTRDVNLNHELIKKTILKVKKDLAITSYQNPKFAFKNRENLKLLASDEFEASIQDASYIEISKGLVKKRTISKDVLIRAKDYFIISSLNGNRVSDLRNIREHHVDTGKQKAAKTNNEFLLNNNKTTEELLRKNGFNLGMNDAKYNKCIKLILEQFFKNFLKTEEKVWVYDRRGKLEQPIKLNTYELAGSHSGRRSFASILYHEGRFTKRTIMMFTGHKSEVEFDKYIQLEPEKDIQKISEFMDINYI